MISADVFVMATINCHAPKYTKVMKSQNRLHMKYRWHSEFILEAQSLKSSTASKKSLLSCIRLS